MATASTFSDPPSSSSSDDLDGSFVVVPSESMHSSSMDTGHEDHVDLSAIPSGSTQSHKDSYSNQSVLISNRQGDFCDNNDDDLLIPNVSNQDEQDERYSSNSSLSSTDSCISQAKYGQTHGFDYDFCLWFVHKNEKEADEIFRILETDEKLRGFRYDRDKNAAKYKLTNISDTIKSSWKIFLLVTPEALEDTWFENQMQQSLTHDINVSNGGVIPILLRVDRTICPSYLQSIFSLFYPTPATEDSSKPVRPGQNHDRFIASLLRVFEPQTSTFEHKSSIKTSEASSASNTNAKPKMSRSISSSIASIFKSRGTKRQSTP